jgi:hypothetical protein
VQTPGHARVAARRLRFAGGMLSASQWPRMLEPMTIRIAGAPLRLPVKRWSIAQRPMQGYLPHHRDQGATDQCLDHLRREFMFVTWASNVVLLGRPRRIRRASEHAAYRGTRTRCMLDDRAGFGSPPAERKTRGSEAKWAIADPGASKDTCTSPIVTYRLFQHVNVFTSNTMMQ